MTAHLPIPEGPTSFEQLVALGPEVMDRVNSMLLSGEHASAIARWIQDDLKKIVGVQHQTLKKALERYRKKDLTPKTLAAIAGASRGLSARTILQRLNSMDELEEMVRHQKLRVEKLLAREIELPKGILLKDTTNEMKLLKEMLVSLSDMQLETGLMQRAPKTVKGAVVGMDGNTRTFQWTEEQETMYREIAVLEEKAHVVNEG